MLNPQNPYLSFILKASAGSGKTYQLSRRFIFLVAAGASPENILTITFTKKAASEMRERILEEAALLLTNKKKQQELDQQLSIFYKASEQKSVPPSTSQAAAAKILSKTQSLQITTIDSIFLDWLSKFPKESQGDRAQAIPQTFTVPSPWTERQLNGLAWEQACHQIFSEFQQVSHSFSPDDIHLRLEELQKNETFFWLCQKQLGDSFIPLPSPIKAVQESNIKHIVKQLEPELLALAAETKKAEQLTRAILDGNVPTLMDLRLLTKDACVSGATIRGKKREKYSLEIARIDDTFRQYFNTQKIQFLNEQGQQISKFFSIYSELREKLKAEMGLVDFSDMSKGCLNLFANPDAFGARFLIHQKTQHLLLDEFQDTSRLQWAIFKTIAEELLAGQGLEASGGLSPSVFIVGDEKQSIYGFREADATILDEACRELSPLGVEALQLDQSYRTSQIILDLVNHIFTDKMSSFPPHGTAMLENKPFIPDFGSIAISELFEGEEAKEDEAKFIAQYIDYQMNEGRKFVWDKGSASLRPLELSDIAILYRSSSSTHLIEKELRAQGIHFIRAENKGYFDRQEVLDILHTLKFLYQQNDLLSFMVLIKSPLCPFREEDVLKTLVDRRKDQVPQDKINRILKEQEANFRPFVEAVKALQHLAHKVNPVSLMQNLFRLLQATRKYREAFGSHEGSIAVQNLHRFLELAFDIQKQGYHSLGSFLQRLEQLKIEDTLGSSQSSSQAVNLMTIHKAKGLEFPLVIVAGLGEAWEKSDRYWLKSQEPPGFYYLGTKEQHPRDFKPFMDLKELAHREDISENIRLLYVAITRAKHHLLLTGQRSQKSKKLEGYWQIIKEKLEDIGANEASLPAKHWSISREPHSDLSHMVQGKRPQQSMFKAVSFPAKSALQGIELETLAPARLLNKSAGESEPSSDDRYSPYARELGLYIHQILEFAIKDKALDHQTWQNYYKGGSERRFNEVGDLALQAAQRTMSSRPWQGLKKSLRIETEKPIVHLSGTQLIRGSIDLLIWRSEKEILVIDYKTIAISQSQNILTLIEEKQYGKQVLAYVQAIKALYPHAKVNGAIYFTDINQVVMTHREYLDRGLTITGAHSASEPEL